MSEENILIVKGILAKNTIIAGTHGYESDTICYIIKEDIFKAILRGVLYIKDTPLNIYKALSISKLWNDIEIKKDKILDGLWKDPYVRNDPYFNKYIYWIENAMITGLFLQHLENKLSKYQQIRRKIIDYEPLAYATLYIYLKKYTEGPIINIGSEKKEEKEDLETILRMYKVINKYDLTKPLIFGDIYRELLMAILNKEYVNIENELKMIKEYAFINKKAKLRKKIKQLKEDKERIEKQIEVLKLTDPTNPEIQELEKEKEEIEKKLLELTKRKKIIKENIQNKNEKAKTKSEELENKNGQ